MIRLGPCVALASLLLVSCGSGAKTPPRLVLLYATCSLNKDFLAPYDSGISFTPVLDAFRREALVFPRHHTESGQSGTSFASLFSGTQAMHHGVYRHPTRLGDEPLLITEAYADAGYETFAFLGHPMASASLNFAQGVAPDNVHAKRLEAESPALRQILERLADDPGYRAFVVTNFTVTHAPYQAPLLDEFCELHPEECRVLASPQSLARLGRLRKLYWQEHWSLSFDFDRTVTRLGLGAIELRELRQLLELLYKADVFRLDRMFGRLLDRLAEHGLLDEALIAFTSDHGEILYREDAAFRWTHGFQLAPEVLNVAFLLYGPGVGVEPGVYPGVTRSIDVFPTLAGLSGIELPDVEGRGTDLSRAVRGEVAAPAQLAFSHTSLFRPEMWRQYRHYEALATRFPEADDPEQIWVAVRSGDAFHKLRRLDGAWRHERFDLPVDPDRGHAGRPASEEDRALATMLGHYKEQLVEGFEAARGARPVESEVELLRSLGYID